MMFRHNIAAEIKQQNAELTERGTKFITAVPWLEVIRLAIISMTWISALANIEDAARSTLR